MNLTVIVAGVGLGIAVGTGVTALLMRSGTEEKRGLMRPGDLSDAKTKKKTGDSLDQGMGAIGSAIARLLPMNVTQQTDLDLSLRLSGSKKTAAQVYGEQLACALILGALGAAVAAAFGLGLLSLLIALIAGLAGFFLPRLVMVMNRKTWHEKLEQQLPDMLDLLCVAVNSGSTLEDGMRIVSEDMQGELAEACGRVVYGAGQEGVAAAFLRFADITGVTTLRNVAHAIWHATQSGAPIANVLAQQADYMRVEHRQRIEEQSEKLDNQMTIDIGLLVMPGVFVGALAPFIYYIVNEALGSGMV